MNKFNKDKMKKKNVTLTAVISLSFDENTQEFKNSIESYRDATESVDDDETLKNDMLQQIAWHVSCFGADCLIEGLGYVSVDGKKPEDEWCGVDIDSDDFTINWDPEYDTSID